MRHFIPTAMLLVCVALATGATALADATDSREAGESKVDATQGEKSKVEDRGEHGGVKATDVPVDPCLLNPKLPPCKDQPGPGNR